MARLKPSWEANINRLATMGDGVFTVVVQEGEIRQVAKRSKDVDNSGRQALFSESQGNAPRPGLSITKI